MAPRLILRDEWLAGIKGTQTASGDAGVWRSASFAQMVPSEIQGIAIHWPGGNGNLAKGTSNPFGYVQGMQIDYRQRHGFDLGYNWVITPNGWVFEARGWFRAASQDEPGNTIDENGIAPSIQFCCDLDGVITGAQVDSCQWQISQIRARWPGAVWIRGHREIGGNTTTCPGDVLIARIHNGDFEPMAQPKGTVFDYLFPFTDPANIKAAGIVAVGRYTGPRSGAIDTTELAEWKRLGVAVYLFHETGGHSWTNGTAFAKQQGAAARSWARSIGIPDERPICCSDFDENIAPTNFPTCLAYMQAFNAGGGQGIQSAYGEGALLEYLKAHGAIRFGIQSMSTSYPGNSTISKATNLLQTTRKSYPQWDPVTYDENFIITPDWGQHPAPPEADLPLNAADLDAITKLIDARIDLLETKLLGPGSDAVVAFLSKMLRGDGPGTDTHDNESIEGAVTQAKAAAKAVTDSQAVILDAISQIPGGGTGGGLTEQQVRDLLNTQRITTDDPPA